MMKLGNGIARVGIWICTVATILHLPHHAFGQDGEFRTESSWIWFPEDVASEGLDAPRFFRRTVTLAGPPLQARVRVLADDSYAFWLNGTPMQKPVSQGRGGAVYDLQNALVPGRNVLAFQVLNVAGPGGIIVTGEIVDKEKRITEIRSAPLFRTSKTAADGWQQPDFDDSTWKPAAIVGSAFAAPWYHHSAFDMEPFLTDADRRRWAEWCERLLRLPTGLTDEAPAKPELCQVNGSCVLQIDGHPTPPFLYRGTVDPMTFHGRRQIALFRDAGVHAYTAYLPLASCWLADDEYDFSALDERVRGYLSVDPDAHLLLILRLVPPAWWVEKHPDDLVRYAMADDFNTSDEAGRVCRPSLASKAWQCDAMAIWRAAIRHLEGEPWGKRVIGYHPGYGIYTEWHYFGSWHHEMPDTGAAMTAAFRHWLRKKYVTDAALRSAWRRDNVALDSVTVPGKEPRLVSRPLGMLLPGQDQWVIDYYRCQQQLTADVMLTFCEAAKEETKGRALAGAFYGYYFGVPPQTQGGHLELERVLKSPAIDYFAAPYDYSHRLVGDDGRGRAVVDAFPLAGKTHMVEVDTRTHLHPRNEHGRVSTLNESLAVIRREVTTTLLHGSALWWCDFGSDGSGGWYDHPKLIAEVAAMNRMASDLLEVPRQRNAQIALVCDLECFFSMADGKAMRAQHVVLDDLCGKLKRLGAPVDMIFLSQLDQADLSRYRLLVFPHALSLTPKQRTTLAQATTGKTTLWLWAPGVTDGNHFSPELVHHVTGISVRLNGDGTVADSIVCPSDHPLTKGIPTETVYELDPHESIPVPGASSAADWFNPRDAKTMKDQYSRFEWTTDDDALQWNFATTASWTDIHLDAPIPQCDGLRFTVASGFEGGQLSLSLVVKGSDGSEFTSVPLPVNATSTTHVLPIASFTKASWSHSDAPLSFPLRGLKLVLRGTSGNRPGSLRFSALSGIQGKLKATEVTKYHAVCQGLPVLTIDDPEAEALGRCSESGEVVVACKGKAPARTVLAAAPAVPLPLLRALADEAGVHRYVDREDVILGADSALIALHTKNGGPTLIHLPQPARVTDAVTGNLVGEGTTISVDLEPISTTILRVWPHIENGDRGE